MRVPQPAGERGSLRWIQRAVNQAPESLDRAFAASSRFPRGQIEWLSPLADDGLAEYRDEAFLERLGLQRLIGALREFWPARGPQWDALGRVGESIVLVEAKSHVRELFSDCTAISAASLDRIDAALESTRAALHVECACDWKKGFYQYANRLAHLHFLRDLHGVDAHLVMVMFTNDHDMRGPGSVETWEAAISVLHRALGLPATITGLHHVHVDVDELPFVPTERMMTSTAEAERRVVLTPEGDEMTLSLTPVGPGTFRVESSFELAWWGPDELADVHGLGSILEADERDDGRLEVRSIRSDSSVTRMEAGLPRGFVHAREFEDFCARVIEVGGSWEIVFGGMFGSYVPTERASAAGFSLLREYKAAISKWHERVSNVDRTAREA